MIENKKNNSKILIIIIIILSILLLASISFIGYNMMISKEKNSQESKKQNKEEIKDKEKVKEVTTDIKLDISNKINNLLSLGYQESNNITDDLISGYYFYDKFIENLEYDNDHKLLLALHKTQLSDVNVDINSIGNNQVKEMIKNSGDTIKQIDINNSKLNDIYKNYFGEEIKSFKSFEDCPSYIYDEATNSYFYSSECGGTSSKALIIHKEDYKINGVDLTVKVYFATKSPVESTNEMGNVKITCGIDCDTVVKVIPYQEDFKIDDSNKDLFDSYIFTFKEDDIGNYYFSKIEKVTK